MTDIKTIDRIKVLHVVDENISFSAAKLIEDERANTVWKALVKCWVTIYTGLLNRIFNDKGSNFGPSFAHMVHLQKS